MVFNNLITSSSFLEANLAPADDSMYDMNPSRNLSLVSTHFTLFSLIILFIIIELDLNQQAGQKEIYISTKKHLRTIFTFTTN